jgi:5-methyltetrahydropteroyltriglutamate--homocysteine methyltransferase
VLGDEFVVRRNWVVLLMGAGRPEPRDVPLLAHPPTAPTSTRVVVARSAAPSRHPRPVVEVVCRCSVLREVASEAAGLDFPVRGGVHCPKHQRVNGTASSTGACSSRVTSVTPTSFPLPILPTSLVGSYAQPDWLIDRAKLAGRFPPRVRAKELWRVKLDYLEQAQDDATVLAVRAQEKAGLDIITDGEMRRESYSNHFATALEGVDIDNPGTALDRSGHSNPVPRIAGAIVRPQPVGVRDLEFLKANTDHTVKMTVPGPFTMSQQAQNDHYPDLASAALAYAAAVNAEIKDLHAAGADVVQIDEPYMQARPEAAREYGLAALNAALEGVTGTTAVHICFGYTAIIHDRPQGYSFLPELAGCSADQISIETAQSGLDLGVLKDLSEKTIILGVIDLSDNEVESAELVADRVRRAFPYTSPDRIIIATDCGMKYLPRASAEGKMRAMAGAASILRAEL